MQNLSEEETNHAAMNNQKPRAANPCQTIHPRAIAGKSWILFLRRAYYSTMQHRSYTDKNTTSTITTMTKNERNINQGGNER
jgi:hypothetical protein